MIVRAEQLKDHASVRAVNASAFETTAEASLVDALREQAHPVVSLVAEEGGEVIGHIMFSPVTLDGHPGLRIMGLAPMAVALAHQRKGVGSALVRAGLEQCRQLGFGAVVVLGHPSYYSRFGFLPSARFGIGCETGSPFVCAQDKLIGNLPYCYYEAADSRCIKLDEHHRNASRLLILNRSCRMQKHEAKLPHSIAIQPQGYHRQLDSHHQLRLDHRSLFNTQLLEDFFHATFFPNNVAPGF